jgi:arsenate reductase
MKRALFVCVGNAGRSQMAQAFYEGLGGEARSAGALPAPRLDEPVVEAMRDVGIDITSRRPKGFTEADVQWADVVVTMGCGDVCPFLPGKQYVDWDLADPVTMSPEEVRGLRDEIRRRVADLAG